MTSEGPDGSVKSDWKEGAIRVWLLKQRASWVALWTSLLLLVVSLTFFVIVYIIQFNEEHNTAFLNTILGLI